MQQAPVAPPARSQYPAVRVRRLDGSPINYVITYIHPILKNRLRDDAADV